MEKIYEINYPSLTSAEKKDFMYRMEELAQEAFAPYSFDVQINAEILIFTRWWNSYRIMAPEEPTPEILDIAMQKLWDFREGKLSEEAITQFGNRLYAASIEIMTGDSSLLEEEDACKEFYAKYFWNWMTFYNSCLDYITTIFCEIIEREVTWQGITGMLDGEIIDLKIGFFEDCVADSSVWSEERELAISNTKTCCEVVALLQKDMRAAVAQKPMSQLRPLYKNEFLFPPEECVKITADWS